jgi:hypothetical protein
MLVMFLGQAFHFCFANFILYCDLIELLVTGNEEWPTLQWFEQKMVATRYQEKPSYEFQNLTTFFETKSLLNGKSF